MQHDNQYPASPNPPVARAGKVLGALAAWALLGLVGVLVASGLLALIVALWRVIL